MDDQEADSLDVEEVLYWAEFCAWSALVMTPIIWWLQGASVSTDQFVVRTGLVVISAGTAVGLRGRKLVQRRRARRVVGGEKVAEVEGDKAK
jgi:hypothetical protein